MNLLASLVMRGCSYEFAMEAKKYEYVFEGDLEEYNGEDQTINGDELYHEEDGSIGYGTYEQGRGIKIIEQDYDGDALNWYGHDHWDDC